MCRVGDWIISRFLSNFRSYILLKNECSSVLITTFSYHCFQASLSECLKFLKTRKSHGHAGWHKPQGRVSWSLTDFAHIQSALSFLLSYLSIIVLTGSTSPFPLIAPRKFFSVPSSSCMDSNPESIYLHAEHILKCIYISISVIPVPFWLPRA